MRNNKKTNEQPEEVADERIVISQEKRFIVDGSVYKSFEDARKSYIDHQIHGEMSDLFERILGDRRHREGLTSNELIKNKDEILDILDESQYEFKFEDNT